MPALSVSFSADGVRAAGCVWRRSSADVLPGVFSDCGNSTGAQFRHHGLAGLCGPVHYRVRDNIFKLISSFRIIFAQDVRFFIYLFFLKMFLFSLCLLLQLYVRVLPDPLLRGRFKGCDALLSQLQQCYRLVQAALMW